jgi:hypothetical protein
MDLSDSVLGRGAAQRLRARIAVPVLRVGRDSFTRRALAQVDCFNDLACRILERHLNDELKVPSLRHVFDKVPPSALAVPGLGAVSLAVLGAAFEAMNIGGDHPLVNWINRHQDGKLTTFLSMKQRELKDQRAEKKQRRQRKAARRDRAHQIRVDRLESRVH